MWFNVLGLLDLVVAVSIGFLAGLGPYRPLEIVPSTEPLSLLPLALVASMAVPLSVVLHIVSLRRLRATTRPEERQVGHPPAGHWLNPPPTDQPGQHNYRSRTS